MDLKRRSLFDAKHAAELHRPGVAESRGVLTGNRMQERLIQELAFVVTLGILMLSSGAIAQTPQEHVHGMSHTVMPFDMAKTMHVFKMTETGGIQRVIVKDRNDSEQVALIRQHLREEASRFQRGDYSDPAKLHGAAMPGLKEVQGGAEHVKVSYAELPDGAEITFETTDLHLLTAIHRWFGAQLSEHGADAKAE
jgi:hypothetical protein